MASKTPTAADYSDAGEIVVRYLLSSAATEQAAAGRRDCEIERAALALLGGWMAQCRFDDRLAAEGGEPDRRSVAERDFCRIADAQHWDDRDRVRLERFIEELFDEAEIWSTVVALAGRDADRQREIDAAQRRRIIEQRLGGLARVPPRLSAPHPATPGGSEWRQPC
jgi:hypothetical protein